MTYPLKKLWSRGIGQYRGLTMRCAPGTHEAVAALLARHGKDLGAGLDLAAGTGALLARLHDLGFGPLAAAELDAANFGFREIEPLPLDLNGEFADVFDGPFSFVTAIEIIEHLDAPRHFLRQIARLVAPGGLLVVSTPNVSHWLGRLRFLAQGDLRYFRERDYHHQRHISPITATHMRLMLAEAGFRVIEWQTAGSFHGPAKRLALSPARLLFRTVCGRSADGDVILYLAQRADAALGSTGQSSETYIKNLYHRPRAERR